MHQVPMESVATTAGVVPARYPESLLSLRAPPHRSFTLADFDLSKEPLGMGKFGSVFRARERASRHVCVLKCIEKEAVMQENVLSQLRREVEVHCRLVHPNIIRMYAYFHDADRAYILLEHANGGTLYDRLSAAPSKRFREAEAAQYTRQLCEALTYVHSRGVIHRDIKPENILLHKPKNGPEVLKLCDFGWSVAQRAESRRVTLCGTVEYLPPEVVDGDEYSFGFDMWTVGVLIYEMLVGHSPFVDVTLADAGADNDGIMHRISVCEFKIPKFLSRESGDLIRKLLVKDHTARLSAADVLRHLWMQKFPAPGGA